ncbi:hypothetical protein [Kitasatospora sp. NPDC093102]|uniref:hypothetical protein n=1 Tax=Kitasatospora sp. NPDC093102 TaxID=3155069 RepID=UPI003434EEE7
MRWTVWEIPGWHEDERLREFYKNAFHPELIDDIAVYRESARDGSPHAGRLRASLEYLLDERPASTREWRSLTRYSFQSEEELYGFLADVRAYFYGERVEPPIAPAPGPLRLLLRREVGAAGGTGPRGPDAGLGPEAVVLNRFLPDVYNCRTTVSSPDTGVPHGFDARPLAPQ